MAEIWTDAQVASLRDFQACNRWHAFTSMAGDVLIPTKEGWVAVEGGPVVQDWAHGFMLDGSWKESVDDLIGHLGCTHG